MKHRQESEPQGKPIGQWVWDNGKSESQLVMSWIGVALQTAVTLLHAKAGRLPAGLSSRESLINRHKVGKQMAVMKQFAQPTPTAMAKSSTDAPTHITNGWHEVTRKVRRLQARIVKAVKTVMNLTVLKPCLPKGIREA